MGKAFALLAAHRLRKATRAEAENERSHVRPIETYCLKDATRF